MNDKEREMYADLIMGMRLRGKMEDDTPDPIPENEAAENLYGEKYEAIREDFTERVAKGLSSRDI